MSKKFPGTPPSFFFNSPISKLKSKTCHICNKHLWSHFQIKGSFYLLIGALCQSSPELANHYADKICPLALHNLDESDPAICPALWEATLYCVTTIEVRKSHCLFIYICPFDNKLKDSSFRRRYFPIFY